MFNYYPSTYNDIDGKLILPYVNKLFEPETVLDVGCGIGAWLKVFSQYPNIKEIVGLDGSHIEKKLLQFPEEHFVNRDLNLGFDLGRKFDILLCLEVAEHLKAESADIFITSLCRHSDIIVFSAAIPGQEGQGHINEQWPDYWKMKFSQNGFDLYDIFRKKFWNNKNVKWWYRQNMFLYARNGVLDYMDLMTVKELQCYVHPDLLAWRTRDHAEKVYSLNQHINNPGLKQAMKQLIKALKQKIVL